MGGAITLSSSGAITTSATGTLTSTGSASTVGGSDTAGAGGEILLHSTGAGAITLGAALTANGGASVEAGDTGGAGGLITLRNDNGAIVLHNLSSAGGAAGGGTAGAGGTLQLKSVGGSITQSGGTTLAGASLKVLSDDDVTLDNANTLSTIAASLSGAGKFFKYTDADGVTVGSVAAVGGGGGTLQNLAAVNGISTLGGATGVVNVTAGGLLTIDQAIATTPSALNTVGGAVILEAGGAITLSSSGTITTTGNTTGAGGEVLIHHTNAGAGAITLGKAITATGGAGGVGGNVTVINDSGAIAANAAIDVSKAGAGASDGTIQLKATGDITDNATGALTGDNSGKLMAYSTAGKIDLTAGTHAVKTASLTTDTTTASTTDGSIKYYDSTDLTIGTAGGQGALVAPSTTTAASAASKIGVTTVAGGANGAVTIRAGTGGTHSLDVTQAIATTPGGAATAGGAVILEAGGAITLSGNGTITTTGNTTGAGGEVLIHHSNAAAGAITLGNAITATGGNGGVGGVVTVINDSGAIAVNAAIDVSRAGAGANDGSIQLQSTGSITGAGSLTGDANGKLMAKTTGAAGVANISLTGGGTGSASSANKMATVAFSTATSGNGSVQYFDNTGVALGTAGGAGVLTTPLGTVAGTAAPAISGATTISSGSYLELDAGGAISQSAILSLGGNLWARTTSGDILLNGFTNHLGGTVSLIAPLSAAGGRKVWIKADSIKVGTVRPSDASTTAVGITAAQVTIEAPNGGATILADGTQGLITADAPLSGTTPALTILAEGIIGNPSTSNPTTEGLRVHMNGLVKVVTDAAGNNTIMLVGDNTVQPKYEFSGQLGHRSVRYNGAEATNAQLTGALDAAYLDIRNQTTETRESGFAKENANKVLRKGVVTSAGPGQTAVDDSKGIANMGSCDGSFNKEELACQ